MSKHKGGFAAPIGEVADAAADVVKGLFSEVGQTVRGHQDNKTKRHVSDNDSGVRHHEIVSADLGKRFDFVIHGFDTLIHGIETIGQTMNESKYIKADLEKALAQEETKRSQALKDLEKARNSFEAAKNQAAMHHESWQKTYQDAVSQSRSAWDKLFALVQSDSISEKDRENYQAQMFDLQKGIKEITISFFEQDSAR